MIQLRLCPLTDFKYFRKQFIKVLFKDKGGVKGEPTDSASLMPLKGFQILS